VKYTIRIVVLVDKLRDKASESLHVVEAFLYIAVGVLLAVGAIGGVLQAGTLMWRSEISKAAADYGVGVLVLDQLLLVLMLIELLHTVRISVRSETLIMEPFLIVGLIASIRRVLVITMQAAKLTEQGQPQTGEAPSAAFRNTMGELGLLGFLILIFVVSIYLLRRSSSSEESLVK
jgi:Phosphate-starvation-inducible E family